MGLILQGFDASGELITQSYAVIDGGGGGGGSSGVEATFYCGFGSEAPNYFIIC